MDVNRILFWIHLIAQAIVDILEALPGDGEESLGDPPSGFKPERIQVWIGIFARAVVQAIDEAGAPPVESGEESAGAFAGARLGVNFKPERIQFWLKLIARFVLAIFDGIGEETGKSGEQPQSGGADSAVDW